MNRETKKPKQPLMSRQRLPLSVIPPRYQGKHLMKNSSLLHRKVREVRTFLETGKKVKVSSFALNPMYFFVI